MCVVGMCVCACLCVCLYVCVVLRVIWVACVCERLICMCVSDNSSVVARMRNYR